VFPLSFPPSPTQHRTLLSLSLLHAQDCPPAGAPLRLCVAAPLPPAALRCARIGALSLEEAGTMTLEALLAGAPVSARNERLALDALLAAIATARASSRHAEDSDTFAAAEEAVINLHRPEAGVPPAGVPPADVAEEGNAELSAALAAAAPALAAAAATAALDLGPKLQKMGLTPEAVQHALADVASRMRLAKLQELASAIGSCEAGDPPAAHACAAAARAVTADVARALAHRGFAVVDAALSASDAEALRLELAAAADAGLLRPVAVQAAVGTRRDVVRYASGGDPQVGPATAAAIALLKGVAAALESADADSSSATSAALPALAVPRNCMLACYPGGGAGYAPHRDNCADPHSASRNRRAVTAILYANEAGWEVTRDGGALRCHVSASHDDDDGCAAGCAGGADWDADDVASVDDVAGRGWCHVDVAPRVGRLVLFRSDALLHEVRPALRHRYAVSLWILDAAPLPQRRDDDAHTDAADAVDVAAAPPVVAPVVAVAAAGSMDALD
jgi:hypothetical protein